MLAPDVAYLNHGAFGALPRPVWEASLDLRAMMERNPSELFSRRLPALLDEVRARLAEFLHADEAGCVHVPNTTTGTATVLTAFARTELDPGAEVLTTDHCHHAVTAQLEVLAARHRIVPVYAPVPIGVTSTTDVLTAITDRITDRTRLLIIDAVASASGFVFPISEIVAAAHVRGLPVLVDGAHAPGQIEVNLEEIGADFWVGNLHKWICSPRAAAILSVAPRWREVIRPLVTSRGYADGLSASFGWTGTFDPVPVLTVPAALDFWDQFGWDAARTQQARLVTDGATTVAAALGTTAPLCPDFRAAMRVVELPWNLSPEESAAIEWRLSAEHLIEVAMTKLAGTDYVRVCGQVYNSPADYELLAAVLPTLVRSDREDPRSPP